MSQRPLLAWLWPTPPPGPLDDQAYQRRWLRVGRRGPIRLALLAVSTILLVAAMGTMVFSVTLSRTRVDDLVGAALLSILALILARAWTLGTYVNDEGIKIVRLTRTTKCSWTSATIRSDDGSVELQTPAFQGATHISRRNLDFLFREEAFLMARDQIINWSQRR